jgi:arylsulfatase A-like enzyme
VKETGTAGSLPPDRGEKRPGFIAFVLFAAWCGLVAGLLEVGTKVICKQTIDPNQFYAMSRHFVSLIPVTNVCVFLVTGSIGYTLCLAWPGRGRWLAARLFCVLTLLPMVLMALPRIHNSAKLILTLGATARLVSLLERHAHGFLRYVRISSPALLAIVLVLGASPWVSDRIKQSRESARPLPSPGSPNVLLIVLDTVAAGHMSLCGYDRNTTPNLVELAEHGIRFHSAQAAAPWTLASHATMFTGRWTHELSLGWNTPLDGVHPTLAEYLGARGYATAGFIANTSYCGSDSGLGRGFTRYQDYIFPGFTAFNMSVLVNRAVKWIQSLVSFLDDHDIVHARPHLEPQLARFTFDRKDAATVNRELLDWLAGRTQTERPFLAFLNYKDAHDPYFLPPGRTRRFGDAPADRREYELIDDWYDFDKRSLSRHDLALVTDAYDDCIAYLDEQLGMLLHELGQRGLLDKTWLIVTADHGESFGEHAGIFNHGMSLYQTELHVPLVIVPPGGCATAQIVKDAVSLRNLAATIVDVLGFESGSPFPGNSLARFWCDRRAPAPLPLAPSEVALAELTEVPRQAALKRGGWTYIRHEYEASEELFHLVDDAKEQRNQADDPAARPILEQMRADLRRLTGQPSAPSRSSR